MKIKDFKQIIKLVSANGLINEFVLQKDNTVNSVDEASTLLVKLKYNGTPFQEDIAVEDSEKLRDILGKFSDDGDVELKDNLFCMRYKTKTSEIPKRSIDTIRKAKSSPNLQHLVTIIDVPFKILQEAVRNKTNALNELYTIEIKDGLFSIIVGNEESGIVKEEICPVPTDKNMITTFQTNIAEVVNNLEANPTIRMGNNFPLRIDVSTKEYDVSYFLAPRVDNP